MQSTNFFGMKKKFFFLLLMLVPSGFAGAQTSIFLSSEWELLFQGASIKDHGVKMNNNMRFTAFFHTATDVHFDFFRWGGIYTGLGIRNIGYIQDDVPDPGVDKIKRRSYTLGIPLVFKVGNMDGFYFFAGGEYEWLFHYKEKTFTGDVKSTYKDWFSNRTKHFLPSVMAGVQMPAGIMLKFKYYLSNFLNEDYVDGNGLQPYHGMDVRMFYVALTFNFRREQVMKEYRGFRDSGVVVRR